MSVIEKDNKFYMSDFVTIMHHERNGADDGNYKHYHDFVELVYTIGGKCVHRIDDVDYSVKGGDMIFINYNQSHTILGGADTEYFNVLLKPEYINMGLINLENAFALLDLSDFEDFTKILDESRTKVTFSSDERDKIEEIISVIQREIEEKKPGYDLAIRSELNLLLIMVFRKMSLAIDEGFGGISEKLLLYIRQHSGQKITLEEIAKKCSYNPSYFSRIFKEYTGKTFRQYITDIRMENAARLLDGTNRSITDICREVGYSDQTKFFVHFKKAFGTTPLQYRKSKK